MMRRNSTATGLKVLSYIGVCQFKNQIIEIFTHPIKAISTILKILLPLAFMLTPMLLRGGNNKSSIPTINLPLNIIGAVLMLLLLIIFFINLDKAVDSYFPTGYSGATVNFLFTSPLSSRLIYAWSILGRIFSTFLTSFFMIFFIFFMLMSFKISMSTNGILYSVLGIALFTMVVQNLNFFLYSISKRFKIRKFLDIAIKLCIGGVLAYFLLLLYKSKDMLNMAINTFGGASFSKLPILGWSKTLIMSPLSKEAPLFYALMLTIFVCVMMIFTIYWATDFYEEAMVTTEKMSNFKAAGKVNNIDQMQQLTNTKKVKVKNVNLNWDFKKAYSFLWKDAVIYSRKSKGPIWEIIKYILYIGIGTGLALAFSTTPFITIVLIVSVYCVMFSGSSFQFMSGLNYELKKSYIFLLPGRVRDKLLAINALPILKLILRNLLMVLPLLFLTKTTFLQVMALWILLCSIQSLNMFTVVTINVILPFESPKNMISIYLKMIIQLVAFIPAGGLAVLLWFFTKNIEASIFLFASICLLLVFFLLYISEIIFYRIELK
ncbi:MAG TPA: putative ABC exporter domain-containing protein [Clostridiaceae bacterium]